MIVALVLLLLGALLLLSQGSLASDFGGTGDVTLNDKVAQLAHAIATAEGFFKPGTIPATYHNPGDLGPKDCPGYPSAAHSGSNVAILPDDATGWNFLAQKCMRILTGASSVNAGKGLNATFTDVAQKYAGDWQNWLNNVTDELGVSADTTLADWLAQ